MKGKFDLETKFDNVLPENLFISEMTLAELKFGVENSEHREKNKMALDNFFNWCSNITNFPLIGLVRKRKSTVKESGNTY
jgi:tRNA(fMet)-specific endonuclease VapC